VHCSHQAADVAQDTFVRLLASGTYVAPGEPRAYLATIARRLLMDNGRRRRLEQAYREELERCAAYLEQAPSPEQILQAAQMLEAIDRALARMNKRIRDTFILRYLVFDAMQLHRIMANYRPENERSARLLARLGFEKEGEARAYLRINGVWADHVLTALINPASDRLLQPEVLNH